MAASQYEAYSSLCGLDSMSIIRHRRNALDDPLRRARDQDQHRRYPRWEAFVTTSSRGRRFALAGLAVAVFGLALAGAILPGAAAAASTNIGYVRLAHLSPDTPDVDVYLDSASSQIKEQVFKGVGYGVMSGYLKLPV